jgi:hypothetical protein
LFIKRPENTAIFFVKRFPEFGHLPFVSSLVQKIFCLEPLGFESSWDRVQNGREPDIPEAQPAPHTHKKGGCYLIYTDMG